MTMFTAIDYLRWRLAAFIAPPTTALDEPTELNGGQAHPFRVIASDGLPVPPPATVETRLQSIEKTVAWLAEVEHKRSGMAAPKRPKSLEPEMSSQQAPSSTAVAYPFHIEASEADK